jgi:hypothetical protein
MDDERSRLAAAEWFYPVKDGSSWWCALTWSKSGRSSDLQPGQLDRLPRMAELFFTLTARAEAAEARVKELEARLDRAIRVLKAVEWCWEGGEGGDMWECLICGNGYEKHGEDCELAALLGLEAKTLIKEKK